MKAIIIKTKQGARKQSNAHTAFGGLTSRSMAKEFVLFLDNVCGIGRYCDVVRVYKAGKTLYIDFESERDAARAMEEIKRAMESESQIVTIKTKAINVSDE